MYLGKRKTTSFSSFYPSFMEKKSNYNKNKEKNWSFMFSFGTYKDFFFLKRKRICHGAIAYGDDTDGGHNNCDRTGCQRQQPFDRVVKGNCLDERCGIPHKADR